MFAAPVISPRASPFAWCAPAFRSLWPISRFPRASAAQSVFARPFAWARSRSKAFALAWHRRRLRRLRLPRLETSPLWWTLRPRCSMSLNPRLWSTRFWLSATWAPRATWRLPSSLWGRALPRRLTATPWSRPCAGIFSAVSLPKVRPSPTRACRALSPVMARNELSTAPPPACFGPTAQSATS